MLPATIASQRCCIQFGLTASLQKTGIFPPQTRQNIIFIYLLLKNSTTFKIINLTQNIYMYSHVYICLYRIHCFSPWGTTVTQTRPTCVRRARALVCRPTSTQAHLSALFSLIVVDLTPNRTECSVRFQLRGFASAQALRRFSTRFKALCNAQSAIGPLATLPTTFICCTTP